MAGLDRFRVVVGTGHGGQAGVVVRLPGVLIVAAVGRPETIETTKRLLALCAEVAGEAGSAATTGSRLPRRVAGLLVDADADRVPDFGLLTTVNDRIAALIHGAMDVVATGPSPVALSGVDSATWVDRLLPIEISRVDVGPTDALRGMFQAGFPGLDDLGFPLDLRIGAVPGIGASLVADDSAALGASSLAPAAAFLSGFESPREPMTEAAAIPTPGRRLPDPMSTAPPALTPLLSKEEEAHRLAAAAEPTQAADFDELDEDPPTALADRELIARDQRHDAADHGHGHGPGHGHGGPAALHDDLVDDLDDDQDAITQLPGDHSFTVSDLIEDDAETMLPSAAQPQVEGILCTHGHFNHPLAPYCTECGISLAQQTNRTVIGPRPPVGVLVFDDGQTVNVDMDLVIGRQPDRDEAVRAGNARPLPVEDGESAVSRVHAVITLNGWDAVITDRGSANGTYIAPPEATVWTPLSPHQPAPLVPGTRVQVGKRTFVFNSHIQV
ncbi:FHA domain-containing protein [Frankia sp. EI5c]|uniref:FHA domain-containing protein n=1 Tax=Frankia sp. EI5c TaxID=683316 RepID=UPI0007C31689|nr:FHA domain-containing protein [Frankia sp. EI5c]OAA25244.1 FHA domain-containing protein [Frankia sp. EI5c]